MRHKKNREVKATLVYIIAKLMNLKALRLMVFEFNPSEITKSFTGQAKNARKLTTIPHAPAKKIVEQEAAE
ncbi:MAG: hypothetical protein GY777_20380 [Candidatus Brocadiaceae bacterium]|nr:hypothetical protein [Candidatus Brocadiaceae bacterium]